LLPTILIALTMLSFSFVGDGLRDALDPRLNK
jgi:oligopeptide transport system permease protein